jgi:MoaA/NifB/PqqE/SkfB family radical SAM enzyme
MTFEQMKTYVDKCLDAYGDSIQQICLTGGECMLLKDDAFRILEYCTGKGLSCNIVSNGFWATSYKKAYEILLKLKNVGLNFITYSTGADHAEWVPLKQIIDAAIASVKLGILTSIRLEYDGKTSKEADELFADKRILKFLESKQLTIEIIRWVKYNNEEKHSCKCRYRSVFVPKDDPCKHLFEGINITPYGDVLACSGTSCTRIPQLRLGNINTEPVKDIYERAFQDHLKIWLSVQGPHHVLKFVSDRTNWFFKHCPTDCDACLQIFGSEKILNFLKDHYFEWAKEISNEYYPKSYPNISLNDK